MDLIMANDQSTLGEFLDAVAAKSPAPGGGAVAGVAGALAAAMGEMVLAYSVNRKNQSAGDNAELQHILTEMNRARALLLTLMQEDQAAFETMQQVKKLPESDPSRAEKLPVVVYACIRIPQTMAAVALSLLELTGQATAKCNYYLLSDLAVAADLSMATLRCALHNVRINLPELADAQDRNRIQSEMDRLLKRGIVLIQQISPGIWTRYQSGK
jgi:formiminotetrahydrofolate cyclodeaminase